jgi:hypothetical protein
MSTRRRRAGAWLGAGVGDGGPTWREVAKLVGGDGRAGRRWRHRRSCGAVAAGVGERAVKEKKRWVWPRGIFVLRLSKLHQN